LQRAATLCRRPYTGGGGGMRPLRFSWAAGRSRRFGRSPHRRDFGLAPSSYRLPLKGGVMRRNSLCKNPEGIQRIQPSRHSRAGGNPVNNARASRSFAGRTDIGHVCGLLTPRPQMPGCWIPACAGMAECAMPVGSFPCGSGFSEVLFGVFTQTAAREWRGEDAYWDTF